MPCLVLSRKIGETIHIGPDIVIQVRRVSGSRCTIAVEAPRDISVVRGEIKDSWDLNPPKEKS